jgi:LuxR family maltose regulon positive regulatory protein
VLIWRGAWDEADAQLRSCAHELEASRPTTSLEALAKLGDLRRRQGRHAEAEELLHRAEGHPLALLGKASLALDRSDPESAIDLVGRFVRRTQGGLAEQVFAFEVAARSRIIVGDVAGAASDSEQAAMLAQMLATPGMFASAALSTGLVMLARGETAAAKDRFEDAVDLFEGAGDLFDAGRARLDLARALVQLDRADAATEHVGRAHEEFQSLGAAFHVQLAAQLLAVGHLDAVPRPAVPA